jgi:HlyD family secretion protein
MSPVDTFRPATLVWGILAIVCVSGCAQHRQAKPSAPYVNTAIASFGTIHPSEQLAGIVAPYENVAIQSTLSEPADSVRVNEGDFVRRGETLAVLDTADLEAQLQSDIATANSDHANTSHTVYQGGLNISQGSDALHSAQAGVMQAQAALTRDQRDLGRDKMLFESGYASEQTYQAQQATVRNDEGALHTAMAQLSSARSQVQANGALGSSGLQESSVDQSRAQEQVALAQAQQVRVQISKATIVSPIDGVIVNRNLNDGEYPGTRQIFTVQQVDPIYAILHGSGQQIAEIGTNAIASITSTDLHGQGPVSGRVIGVLNAIAPGSTDFQVKVLVSNPKHQLRPGMAIQGVVNLPPIQGIRIPQTAFTDDNHNAILSVQPDGTIKTLKVAEVGNDGTTSLVKGLTPGVRVVQDGQMSVGDGEKVSFR